jgi:hypothetical protein
MSDNNYQTPEINNIEIDKTITTTGKPFKHKGKFEKACTHCNKILKTIKSYENHINTQVCYSRDEISYCKLCKLLLSNNDEYIKHLLSMEHINKIGCNNLEVLHTNQPSTILQADPYLTPTEARSIGTNNLGNKFTFVFSNNSSQTINLISNNTNNTNNTNTNTKADSNREIIPTVKQLKILNILSNIGTINEGIKAFITILDNKLNIEDYNGMQYIIKNDSNMKSEYKNAYLETIDKYVSMLIKRRTNGETTYKDKDISKVVISLTI